MAQGLCEWRLGAFRPADQHTIEAAAKIKPGTVLRVQWARVRNPDQLALWWALADTLADYAEWCVDKDDASDWLKVSVGHFDMVTTPDGKQIARAKSIAFGNCDQDKFDKILSAAIAVVCDKIIPGTSNAELRARLEEITGLDRREK